MTKITLDRETFKALASDTRLDILKALDGKNLGLNEIAKISNLNKATLHEHLTKLNDAGLIKRNERDGHKWVYYKLTWKGESLLHPENTKIVVLFTTTFVALWIGIIQLIWYIKGTVMTQVYSSGNPRFLMSEYATKSADAGTYVLSIAPSESLRSGFINPFQNFLMRTGLMNGNGMPLSEHYTHGYYLSDSAPAVSGEGSQIVSVQSPGIVHSLVQNQLYLNIAVGCFIVCTVVLGVAVLRFWANRTAKI
jgi:DNA-binding transcriptional ArsR family regulator